MDEAVRAAWDSYRILEKRTPEKERRQAQQRVQAAMDSYGREEVSRGAVFLVGVLTAHIIGQPHGAEEDRLDPLSDLIPAVIRKLPDFESADPAQVPMVTGVLMAAAMGMDTVAWRDQFGTIPPKEALVHNFVLWLLADLFDSLVEQPGATDQLMRETFNSMAADDAGWQAPDRAPGLAQTRPADREARRPRQLLGEVRCPRRLAPRIRTATTRRPTRSGSGITTWSDCC
ncbi:hypothetical protein [Streptomyces sparsogenes]|uniref:Uncharacterized protein n=1 Tax=Streptomyces sparsogenes DSM 40356 TaxID=1331668 RepID=A0A1R1S447_9ACTN|nr:hypothetical protein [Streptomyces sparsogenes]OMI33028.1 hypothetical protein SPAR_43441 [Streptomyces sparsogenes DSM 40356]